MSKRTSKKYRDNRNLVFSSAIHEDVLSEKKLTDLLDLWTNRLEDAKDPKYADQCQKMVKLYQLRIERLGVRLPCVN